MFLVFAVATVNIWGEPKLMEMYQNSSPPGELFRVWVPPKQLAVICPNQWHGPVHVTSPQTPKKTANRKLRLVLEYALAMGAIFAMVLTIRSLLFQVYEIPTASMEPTVEVGDRIVVNRLDKSPEESELIVFANPLQQENAPDLLVKRVVAVEGSIVGTQTGLLVINGQPLGGLLAEDYIASPASTHPGPNQMWNPLCVNPQGDGTSCAVPVDHVYVMGDNRQNSVDSRVFGPVPVELIQGTVVGKVWPPSSVGRIDH